MGKLILIPTPIGNLGDITLRAIECIKSVDILLVEDTRKTGKLLKHLEIEKKMWAHHAHNVCQGVFLSAISQQIKLPIYTTKHGERLQHDNRARSGRATPISAILSCWPPIRYPS